MAGIGGFESGRFKMPLLRESHAVRLFPAFRDPKLYRWISMRPPDTPEDLVRWWWCSGDNGPGECEGQLNFDWVIMRRDNGTLVGKLDAEFAPSGVVTNLGYIIDRRFWNRRYATEAVAALLEEVERHGFGEQRAYVTQGNMASVRVLERLAFRRKRILRANDTIRGVAVDDIEFIRHGAPAA
jgi:RimJ/RimL family protein N-acetyltransferase